MKKKETAPQAQPEQAYSTLREYFVATVYCTIIALFVTTYVVHPMTVPTPSMEPTILVGDRLLIDKFTYRNGFLSDLGISPAHEIKRGDVVVFKYPEDPNVLYVKRAIGLPGETLEVRDKTVYINGRPLDEPYKVHRDPRVFRRSVAFGGGFDNQRDNFGPVRIPEGSYFMMGDNRDDSADSRYFGFLPKEYIVGRPLVVFWSYEDASDAYRRTSLPEMLKLYAERVVFFITKTRWSRMGHFVR
jgi:signal peptidase I